MRRHRNENLYPHVEGGRRQAAIRPAKDRSSAAGTHIPQAKSDVCRISSQTVKCPRKKSHPPFSANVRFFVFFN